MCQCAVATPHFPLQTPAGKVSHTVVQPVRHLAGFFSVGSDRASSASRPYADCQPNGSTNQRADKTGANEDHADQSHALAIIEPNRKIGIEILNRWHQWRAQDRYQPDPD